MKPSEQARPADVGLPMRPFLYTQDQIAGLLSCELPSVNRWTHYDGRSVGARPADLMLARNIANDGDKPEWRVAEGELIRWLKRKGFKFYDRGWLLF